MSLRKVFERACKWLCKSIQIGGVGYTDYCTRPGKEEQFSPAPKH